MKMDKPRDLADPVGSEGVVDNNYRRQCRLSYQDVLALALRMYCAKRISRQIRLTDPVVIHESSAWILAECIEFKFTSLTSPSIKLLKAALRQKVLYAVLKRPISLVSVFEQFLLGGEVSHPDKNPRGHKMNGEERSMQAVWQEKVMLIKVCTVFFSVF
jgi:hypothetical protein